MLERATVLRRATIPAGSTGGRRSHTMIPMPEDGADPHAGPIGTSTVAPMTRVPPLVLATLGFLLLAGLGDALLHPPADLRAPWWAFVLASIPAGVLAFAGAALAINPRPLVLRRALAGAALAWLLLLAAMALLRLGAGWFDWSILLLTAAAVVDGAALLAMAATTPAVSEEPVPDPLSRMGAVVAFTVAIFVATLVVIVAVNVGLVAWRAIGDGAASGRLPWGAVILVLVLPAITFLVAAAGTRRASGGTFVAQAAANRRNSLLLLVTLVGVVAATAEIIAVSLTLSPVPALWAAGIAAAVGLAAALGANRFGAQLLLQTAGCHPADPVRDEILLNVVRELALAAGLPEPRVFVIEDGSQNAFATGRDPAHAAIAVTRGLLDHMDREELQGVVGHEMGHVRNLDTRYALYVAILVGLVALVTDGFLRLVLAAWREGAFFWSSDEDAKSAIASFVSGILVGLALLTVALLLRVVAPLFSLLVQAAVTREREFLADATSVELTRNPMGLERALASIGRDRDPLGAANRGTQHLWFRNPITPGSDRRPGILATHPSIGARIERLRRLRGLDAPDTSSSTGPLAEET